MFLRYRIAKFGLVAMFEMWNCSRVCNEAYRVWRSCKKAYRYIVEKTCLAKYKRKSDKKLGSLTEERLN